MILNEDTKRNYYKALVNRDSNYEGIFYAGIKTTGIFCHPTCRARKPKYENCDFFLKAEEALLSGYRPCKICEPLNYPGEIPQEVKELVQAVESNPEKRWKDRDFLALGIHSATARRLFKKHYHMTFVQYARARRLGIAFKSIQQTSSSKKIIDVQLDIGYHSASGFNDAFSRIMGNSPKKSKEIKILCAKWINTPLGPMIAIADDDYLYLLEFADRRGLEREIEKTRTYLNARVIPGSNEVLVDVEKQLEMYFNGTSLEFELPLSMVGSEFVKQVWNTLLEIPIGETRSYRSIAKAVNRESAARAVGRANGMNQIAIVIPCHRVIQADQSLGGYGGGVERKKWLLEHELKFKKGS